MSLVLRNVKGSQLTFNEMDGNFTYLEGQIQGRLSTSSFNAATGSFVTTSSFNTFTSTFNTGSFTGSFRGDGSGLTGISGTSISTGSFATTGSNRFTNNQTITGSLTATQTISSQVILTPQILTGPTTIPSGFNGILAGPVSNLGVISIESGSTLTII